MSIQGQIDRLEKNVADTYDALSESGVDMPTQRVSANLAATAARVIQTLLDKFADYLPLAGGTMTGNLAVGSAKMQTNGYVIGTWLQTTEAGKATGDTGKIAVLDGSGWIYYRTTDELAADIAAKLPTWSGGEY